MTETVNQLLSRLGLSEHAAVFEEEAITDVSLLESMGREMLHENLEELGLEDAVISKLADDLFGGAAEDEDEELMLEDNATASGVPPVPSGAPPAPPPPQTKQQQPLPAPNPAEPVDTLPNDLTQEEIDAAEAEAQWLLNPLSMMDLSETKKKLLKTMAEGVSFQKRGQPANARATYTRAINMEAPNKRMQSALFYNRSACQRQLGQLGLALSDAQKAAELDPTNLKALWRAADVAIVMGNQQAASEAVTAGLKQSPKCQPLLQLKLQIQRF